MSAPKFTATLDKVLGVICLVSIVPMVLAGFVDTGGNILLFGSLTVLVGASALFGVRSLRGTGAAKPAVSAAILKELVADRAIPFSVCTACRIVIELPHAFSCPECGLTDCCVAVHEESERSIAVAAIGVDA